MNEMLYFYAQLISSTFSSFSQCHLTRLQDVTSPTSSIHTICQRPQAVKGFSCIKQITHLIQRVQWMQRVIIVFMRGPTFLSSTALKCSCKQFTNYSVTEHFQNRFLFSYSARKLCAFFLQLQRRVNLQP